MLNELVPTQDFQIHLFNDSTGAAHGCSRTDTKAPIGPTGLTENRPLQHHTFTHGPNELMQIVNNPPYASRSTVSMKVLYCCGLTLLLSAKGAS